MNPDNLFFTGDTHFGHQNIIKYCKRPFTDKDDMDAGLIAAWNQTVPPEGVVFHLGDVSFRSTQFTETILSALNGHIHLIEGNHDKGLSARAKTRFESILPLREVSVPLEKKKQKIILCHYAMRVWNASHHGTWQLFGHSHGSMDEIGLQMDVGIDAAIQRGLGPRPFTFWEVAKIMDGKKIKNTDYHYTKRS